MRRGMVADGPSIAVRVPAKINLFLAVRDRYADGYHELATVLQTISIHDEVRVGVVGPPGRAQHPAGRRRMRVELWHDPKEGMPTEPDDNLAIRAARALGEATGILTVDTGSDAPRSASAPRTVVDLSKHIPVGGGMAGGSADAAGALVALNELWNTDLSRDQLKEIAAGLGSDVPFCVMGGTALATGRGTAAVQVLCRGVFHWVVCASGEPLPTAEVYRAWDRHCRPSEVEPDAVLAALGSSDPLALGAALHNDLEPAAFALRPELEANKSALLDAGALGALVSGSGPTVLGLAADAVAAQRLADAVSDRFDRVWTAHSPAGGPEVRPC